jgi:predicted dehydrogenase
MSALRWGILGASSRIASKAVVPALEAGDRNVVTAQASRDGSGDDRPYAELLGRGDVDAVYIPLPNALHKPWVERALAAASTCCARSRSA